MASLAWLWGNPSEPTCLHPSAPSASLCPTSSPSGLWQWTPCFQIPLVHFPQSPTAAIVTSKTQIWSHLYLLLETLQQFLVTYLPGKAQTLQDGVWALVGIIICLPNPLHIINKAVLLPLLCSDSACNSHPTSFIWQTYTDPSRVSPSVTFSRKPSLNTPGRNDHSFLLAFTSTAFIQMRYHFSSLSSLSLKVRDLALFYLSLKSSQVTE